MGNYDFHGTSYNAVDDNSYLFEVSGAVGPVLDHQLLHGITWSLNGRIVEGDDK